jgi:hypothetical protein
MQAVLIFALVIALVFVALLLGLFVDWIEKPGDGERRD